MLDWFSELPEIWDSSFSIPLPKGEDQFHEYKASRVSDADLSKKIGVAASAFWNAGGGIFVCGVNSAGDVDEGRPIEIGRQSLRDWVDQILVRVHPPGPYEVKIVQKPCEHSSDKNGILFVRFFESPMAPHMAPDNQYYVRSGAHSFPAAAFVVEALFSRRQASQPLLRHVLRINPDHGRTVQLGIVAASNVFALDVEISLPALRLLGEDRRKFKIAAIGPGVPFYTDIDFILLDGSSVRFDGKLVYKDSAGRSYYEEFSVDSKEQMGVPYLHDSTDRGIQVLKGIENHIGSFVYNFMNK